MKQKEIKVLMVEPGKHPRVTTLKNDLDSLQEAVSIGVEQKGLIEIIGIAEGVCILCNEEGKLIGLEGNRRLGADILVGVFYGISAGQGDRALQQAILETGAFYATGHRQYCVCLFS